MPVSIGLPSTRSTGCAVGDTFQPTMRRASASIIKAAYTNQVYVETYLKSPTAHSARTQKQVPKKLFTNLDILKQRMISGCHDCIS